MGIYFPLFSNRSYRIVSTYIQSVLMKSYICIQMFVKRERVRRRIKICIDWDDDDGFVHHYLPRRTPSLGKSRLPKRTASLGKSRLPKRMASLGRSRLPKRTGS